VIGGTIDELRPFLNTGDEKDFVLLVSWLLGAMNSRGPYPVLVLQGEAGSAKTSAARVLRELIDPNTTPLRSEPRENRDLMIAAQNSWCVAFDNVSHLTPWLSDSLCRLSTGGGFSTRELYSDDQEKLFEATRPGLLNGIEGIVSRGDLLDRSLTIYLPSIPEKKRKSEKEFWREFEIAKPRILGALLNAVVCGLRRLPDVALKNLPRMADFAEWITALEPSLGWKPETFMKAYTANRVTSNSLALEASPIVTALRELCDDGGWEGTAAELLRELNLNDKDRTRNAYWPKTPWALSRELRRIAPNLRETGVHLIFGKTPGTNSARVITITQIAPKRAALVAELDVEALYRKLRPESPIFRFPREIQRFPRERDASDA